MTTTTFDAALAPGEPPSPLLSRAGAPQPFLSLVNAAFRLGDRLVFRGLSWTLGRREQWAVTGPNGSGKTLLGEALRGRLPLVQGELRYHFRTPPVLTPEELIGHVSFEDRRAEVGQTLAQSRWNSLEEESSLRVRDFFAYERAMELNPFEVVKPAPRVQPQFECRRRRALRLFRVEPLLEQRLLSLSNGERQRVQLARALCHPLRLLILDEPFVGLDAAMRAHLSKLLEHLMQTRLRTLLLTTRLEDLPRHVTHLLLLERCQAVAGGPKADLLARHGRGGVLARVLAKPSGPGPAPRRPRPQRGRELIRLRQATVRYGRKTILAGLDWTVRAGESWALLGPNGSGKTTLLSLILGDNPQVYRNDVVVFGRRRGTGESVWDIKRRLGWVSPELHLHFARDLDCLAVVVSGFHDTVGLFVPPNSRQRAAARRWLARFGLADSAGAPLFALSAGLQRMVLLARALVKRPELLILDEPCQGLDLEHRTQYIAAVDALIRAGTTAVIYVTHRKDEIPPSIRRVLRLPRRAS